MLNQDDPYNREEFKLTIGKDSVRHIN
jgi:hypothetical protein